MANLQISTVMFYKFENKKYYFDHLKTVYDVTATNSWFRVLGGDVLDDCGSEVEGGAGFEGNHHNRSWNVGVWRDPLELHLGHRHHLEVRIVEIRIRHLHVGCWSGEITLVETIRKRIVMHDTYVLIYFFYSKQTKWRLKVYFCGNKFYPCLV